MIKGERVNSISHLVGAARVLPMVIYLVMGWLIVLAGSISHYVAILVYI